MDRQGISGITQQSEIEGEQDHDQKRMQRPRLPWVGFGLPEQLPHDDRNYTMPEARYMPEKNQKDRKTKGWKRMKNIAKRSPCALCEYETEDKLHSPICQKCEARMEYSDSMGKATVAGHEDMKRSISVVKDNRIDLSKFEKIESRKRYIGEPGFSIWPKGSINFNAMATKEMSEQCIKTADVYIRRGQKKSTLVFVLSTDNDRTYKIGNHKKYALIQSKPLIERLKIKPNNYTMRKENNMMIAEVENG